MAALASLLPGIGGIVTGILGGNAASKAGKTIQEAGTAASTATGTAGNQAAAGTNKATDTGVAGINDATGTGTAGILNAGTNAAAGVNAAAGQANTTAGNLLGGQLQNLSPYLSTGSTGSNALNSLISQGFQAPTAEQVESTPGYQFQQQQGLKGVLQTLNAQGGGATGGAEKALEQYGQGVASTYYQNAFNNALQGYGANVNTAALGAGQGLQSSQLANQAAQNFGNIYNSNTLGAAQYGGNAGITTNTTAGQLGLQGALGAGQLGVQGAETAGNQNLQGTIQSGNFFLQGAQGAAAGTLGQANGINSAIGAGVNGVTNYFNTGNNVPQLTGTQARGPNTAGAFNNVDFGPGGYFGQFGSDTGGLTN